MDQDRPTDQAPSIIDEKPTPRQLAEQLLAATLAAQKVDDLGDALADAVAALITVADHEAQRRRAAEPDDDVYDNMPNSIDPSGVLRALVEEYGADLVCKWARESE